MKLRTYILLFLLMFALTPLILAVSINLPLVLDRIALFYQRAYLQNLRADFRDLDQHLASRQELIRFLSKLPEPGVILGERGDADEIDIARARYTGWVNQVLSDQRDVTQILFVDDDSHERFWLVRDPRTQVWRPTEDPLQLPNSEFVTASLGLRHGAVMVSRIRIDPGAGLKDPRQLMTLNLVSSIGGETATDPHGLVVVTIDVGGLAQFYRDTLWVNQDGSYLRPGQPVSGKPEAFADFPGLEKVFAEGTLAVWKADEGGRQYLWVPMFLTEDGLPLWVGRAVDPSPIDDFRNALMLRVLSIILLLVLVVMFLARWIASRAEQFGNELTGGISQVLRDGQPRQFHWRGPREIQQLGEQLTALASTHAEHLRAAREHTLELEKSNRYKSEFLANVSHELRTPLNSILLLSKLLSAETSGLGEGQRRQAQVINDAGRDLHSMIDSVLDISRIEAGHVPVAPEWVELGPVIDELVELVRPLLGEKPVKLDAVVSPDVPTRLFTDCDKLRQILKNLLANAIKFTNRGSVVLAVEPGPDAVRPVAISVTDTGIGIPEDKQEIIFEVFQQADGSTRRRYGGTGLGLTISRELARLLGGTLGVQSAPGAGSCFTLSLPISLSESDRESAAPGVAEPAEAVAAVPLPIEKERVAAEKPIVPPHVPSGDSWVLVIERDVATLISLASLITDHGLSVQTAADLDEAMDTLQEESAGCVLVLLAARVSEELTCDTIESLLEMNQEEPFAVAVLGGSDSVKQLTACEAAGAIAFLAKPVEKDELGALLVSVLGRRGENEADSVREDIPLEDARA